MKSLLKPLYGVLEGHGGYRLLQRVGRPTTDRFRILLRRHVLSLFREGDSVLDLACGVGAYCEMFPERYCGVDINRDYIAAAQRCYSRAFHVMDCLHLQFSDASFDHAVSIAGTHHFDDAGLISLLAEAQRVVRRGGCVHVIDAVLPLDRLHLWKEAWFRLDRGQHPRRATHLQALIGRAGAIETLELMNGPLHDVGYFRLRKR